MATTATTIEARFAQIHPRSKPAPIYKMSNLTSKPKPAAKHTNIDPRDVARKLCEKRFGHLFEHGQTKRLMGAGTPPRARDCGDLRRISITTPTTPTFTTPTLTTPTLTTPKLTIPTPATATPSTPAPANQPHIATHCEDVSRISTTTKLTNPELSALLLQTLSGVSITKPTATEHADPPRQTTHRGDSSSISITKPTTSELVYSPRTSTQCDWSFISIAKPTAPEPACSPCKATQCNDLSRISITKPTTREPVYSPRKETHCDDSIRFLIAKLTAPELADVPRQATHCGDRSSVSIPKPTPTKPADPPEPASRSRPKTVLNRLAHLAEFDLVKPTMGLGTPSQARNMGDLTKRAHITDENHMLANDFVTIIMDKERRRSPERRLEGARELLDWQLDMQQEDDARLFGCTPRHVRYPRPERRLPELRSEVQEPDADDGFALAAMGSRISGRSDVQESDMDDGFALAAMGSRLRLSIFRD